MHVIDTAEGASASRYRDVTLWGLENEGLDYPPAATVGGSSSGAGCNRFCKAAEAV